MLTEKSEKTEKCERLENSLDLLHYDEQAKSIKSCLVSGLFGLWNVLFCSVWANLAVLVSGRWMVNNMRKSMSLTIGTSYWKGVFVQCKM